MNEPLVFIPLLFVAAALVFWAWMFRNLWASPDLPVSTPAGLSWPPESKNAWTAVFIVLNIFGAALYFSTVYRRKP